MLGLFSNPAKSSRPTPQQKLDQDRDEALMQELVALKKSMDLALARIEFTTDGIILDANENFLGAMGYSLNEIKGKHHKIFVESSFSNSDEYRQFWRRLANGEAFPGQFKRVAKGNRLIWIDATYVPVFDRDGTIIKVIKFARDISTQKAVELVAEGFQTAVGRQFALIEFDASGTILTANDNFLGTMGYSLRDIVGKHHSMFVSDTMRISNEYSSFWRKLGSGEGFSGQCVRVGRGGKEVWLNASYNPILDIDGKVNRVVKYATDITELVVGQRQSSGISEAISGSVSQFSMTITEISANVNRTASLAQEAKEIAGETCTLVEGLDESSRVIGKIVEVIQELADQTNLLALNATIESARAGEAGRGFAVVASAVKDLAKQTAAATKNIETTVDEIQKNIQGVVGSTNLISRSVSEVHSNMTTIAAAVEEQSVTIESINRTAEELRSLNSTTH